MARKPLLAITLGDFNGIGPEVTLKCVTLRGVRAICTPLLVGSIDVYEYYARRLHLPITLRESRDGATDDRDHSVMVFPLHPFRRPSIAPGAFSPEAGRYAGEAIEAAADLCLRERVDGMVTAPVSKEAMAAAGFRDPGQTELLARLSRTSDVAMMLIARTLRVGLATVHIPISAVPGALTRERILRKLGIIDRTLRRDLGIRSPRIGVLGLNPHAGEHGLMGNEERRILEPTIRLARGRRIDVEGPFPADGFFGSAAYRKYDAILAMYHDQGLIPLKMLGFSVGVNFSAGLSLVRTSPDHGTAFAIAGRGVADPSSMIEAVKLAVEVVRRRKNRRRA